MRGDFSRLDDSKETVFTGVMHQQGRVLLDSDWNDQLAIEEYWKQIFSRDVIGGDVVAVPAATPDAFKVLEFQRNPTPKLRAQKGEVWLNGKRYVNTTDSQVFWDAPLVEGEASSADREAILLRGCSEEVSAYQDYNTLAEVALGGPDTTVRIRNTFSFCRLPLTSETCEDIRAKILSLKEKISEKKAQLSVEFDETLEQSLDGNDCPAVQVGGYRGLEHFLYRIEIAEIDSLEGIASKMPFFKWSQFNGGLVGNGYFKKVGEKIIFAPTRNIEAIRRSGLERLDTCYLEVYKVDEKGQWILEVGTEVHFNENELVVDKIYKGVIGIDVDNGVVNEGLAAGAGEGELNGGTSGSNRQRFFRLWSGIESLKDYTERKSFRDGIRLQFKNIDGLAIRPGDFWTFEVRAYSRDLCPRGFAKDQFYSPHGPKVDYACLGIVETSQPDIHDCRRPFEPLVDQEDGCCIEVDPEEDLVIAIDKLRALKGGCVCLKPGRHLVRKTLDLRGLKGVVFKGSGPNCELIIPEDAQYEEIFNFSNSTDLRFSGFSIILAQPSIRYIWRASTAFNVHIEDTQVVCAFSKGEQLFSYTMPFAVDILSGLVLQRNLWMSWKSMTAKVLSDAQILNNWFLFSDTAFNSSIVSSLVLSNNRFIAIAKISLESPLERIWESADPVRIVGIVSSIVASLGYYKPADEAGLRLQQVLATTAVQFGFGIQVHGKENLFSGARGVKGLICLKSRFEQNTFFSSISAIELTMMALEIDICDNSATVIRKWGDRRVVEGYAAFDFGGGGKQITVKDNDVRHFMHGILFSPSTTQTDLGKLLTVARSRELIGESTSSASLQLFIQLINWNIEHELTEIFGLTEVAGEDEAGVLVSLLNMAKTYLDRSRETAKPLDGIALRANDLQTSWHGIEISGDRSVRNYSIIENRISGCDGAGVYLPVKAVDDAEKKLQESRNLSLNRIAHNQISGTGIAIWCFTDNVRIEGNDVLVSATPLAPLELLDALFETWSDWNEIRSMAVGETTDDLDTPEVMSRLLAALIVIRKGRKLEELLAHRSLGWVSFIQSLLIDTISHENNPLFKLAKQLLAEKLLEMLIASLRGFAVAVYGGACSLRTNRILTLGQSFVGGIILGSQSGEVTDNDILAPRIGIILPEHSITKVKTLGNPIQIQANKIRVSIRDQEARAWSILIPRILGEDISVTDNHLMGDVHIGSVISLANEKVELIGVSLKQVFSGFAWMTKNLGKLVGHTKVAYTNLTNTVEEPIIHVESSPLTRFMDLPRPKVLVTNNQVKGSVHIVPFGVRIEGSSALISRPAERTRLFERNPRRRIYKILARTVRCCPLVTFNSNQLESENDSMIFGFQTIVVGNQMISSDFFSESPEILALGFSKKHLRSGLNIPFVQAGQTEIIW